MNIKAFENIINNAKKSIKAVNTELLVTQGKLKAAETKITAAEAANAAIEARVVQAEKDISDLQK